MQPKLTSPTLILFVLVAALTASGRQAGAGRIHRLALPSKDWSLDVALTDFTVESDTVRPDGRERIFVASYSRGDKPQVPTLMPGKESGILVIQLMPAKHAGGAAEFRDFAVALLKETKEAKKSSFKTSEYNGIPVARYERGDRFSPGLLNPESPASVAALIYALSPRYRMAAYFVKDDVWILLGLAAQSLGAEEEKLFYSVLDGVKFTDTSAPARSFDLFHKGRPLRLQGEHARALEYYRRALELERRGRQLDDLSWRMLVEETANEYAATGDLKSAKGVLEYGVAKEQTNARFHYSLARVHAALDDLDNAVASLEKAFLYKKSTARPVYLPQPKDDPAFERFLKADKFRQALKAMKP